jgi:glycine hydroxymethyltransferase
LTQIESERQARKLILIPSESQAPLAVREAMSSAFQNIYAEGYPDEESRWMSEEEILDYPARLAHYRRNSDPRYYKGTEYADAIEALARRRCAEAFAANGVTPPTRSMSTCRRSRARPPITPSTRRWWNPARS